MWVKKLNDRIEFRCHLCNDLAEFRVKTQFFYGDYCPECLKTLKRDLDHLVVQYPQSLKEKEAK